MSLVAQTKHFMSFAIQANLVARLNAC